MMTLYFSYTVIPECATYATTVNIVDGMKLLKDGYSSIRLDGRIRCCSVRPIPCEDDFYWTPEPT